MGGRAESPGKSPRYHRAPHPQLRAGVVEYWAMARNLGAMGGFTVTPDALGELICCPDEIYAMTGANGARERLPTCFLVGLLAGPLRLEAPGVVRCVAARLHPWAVGRLMGASEGAPARGWSDARCLLGAGLGPVLAATAQEDWSAASAILEEVLLASAAVRGGDPGAGGLVASFLGSDRCPTATVAATQAVSPRQVERRVRQLTGTSPRQLASLARFGRVRDALWADPTTDLAGLALAVGYADQPHMTREFRRFAGLTPTQFRRAMADHRRQLATDVAIVQSPGAADR